MKPFLQVVDLTKYYGSTAALEGCSFDLPRGHWLSVFGPSGSGKTTLLRLLAGVVTADRGQIRSAAAGPGLLVYQDYLLFPHLSVLENAAFGLRARGDRATSARRQARNLLERLGLADKAAAYPHELSAGQQQRTALARALVLEPALLLLDEPFANLDPDRRTETAQLIRDLQRERGLTIVCVSHQHQEAREHSDQILHLDQGRPVPAPLPLTPIYGSLS